MFGRSTEVNFVIEDEQGRENLKRDILCVATEKSFLRNAGFESIGIVPAPEDSPDPWLENLLCQLCEETAEGRFYHLLRSAEVVGSRRGGAAGYLKVEGQADYKLRIAIIPEGGCGVFSREIIIKHELGHFVREAKVKARRRSWSRRLWGAIITAAVLTGGLMVVVPWWVAGLALFAPLMWFLESDSLFKQERRRWFYLYNRLYRE